MQTITLGLTQQNKKWYRRKLYWQDRNFESYIIAGLPGYGKSHTAAFILTQLAFLGFDILLADYSDTQANITGESLSERLEHIQGAILRTERTRAGIESMVDQLLEIRNGRREGTLESTPLVFVFDEFPQFVFNDPKLKISRTKNEKDDEGWNVKLSKEDLNIYSKLKSLFVDTRKYNISIMFIGQEWSANNTTTEVRMIRELVHNVIFHRLNDTNIKMLGVSDKAEMNIISNLKKGQCFLDGMVINVPYPLQDEFVRETQRRIAARKPRVLTTDDQSWRDDEFLQRMFEKYGTMVQRQQEGLLTYRQNEVLASIPMETKDDLLHLLLRLGKSNNWIISMIKGKTTELNNILTRMKGIDNAE